MSYLTWKEQTITEFSPENIESLYNQGFVFTRIDKGVMHQTRSARVELDAFTLTSENRRILKKNEELTFTVEPLPFKDYSWQIGKMGKDFYTSRSADFSANKIKELMTNADASNFTHVLAYSVNSAVVGYCIAVVTDTIVHYSYPFYTSESKDLGLGMILKTLEWAQAQGKTYFYLGSLQRPSDTYKLQLNGIEWFDGTKWSKDIEPVKEILRNSAL
jgi:arginyl-tRNA--protein-N-Asp/Glu arginylyltransferase